MARPSDQWEASSAMMTARACGQHDRRESPNDGEGEQIRPLKPAAHVLQVLGERVEKTASTAVAANMPHLDIVCRSDQRMKTQ